MNVAKEKVRGVDEHTSAFFRGDFKAPERRLRERVFHCVTFVRVVGDGAKIIVRRDEQHAWTTAIEAHDRAGAELTAIESDVVRTDAGGQGFNVEKLAVPLVDLEPDLARLRVPVEGEEAGKLLHAFHLVCDRLSGHR